MKIAIDHLTKRYGRAASAAVADLNLDVAPGEFLTLLGPSGCGKTTTLRCIAGLEVATSGSIRLGDRTVSAPEERVFVPPEKRGVGMVFQSYALWPHMTVFGNVAYPLRMAGRSRRDITGAVGEALEKVGLTGHEHKSISALSGGQQQRVALARAMVGRPSVMLYDEPLSNLDAKLRFSMRDYIRNVHDDAGATSVYVTHDQEEAIALSDRIIVLQAGRIEQEGTPRELYARPASVFVADFMGFQNIVPGQVVAREGRRCRLRITGAGELWSTNHRDPSLGAAQIAFRATHLRFAPPSSESVPIRGTVVSATDWGSAVRAQIDLGGVLVRALVDEAQMADGTAPALRAGDAVETYLRPEHVVVLPDDPVLAADRSEAVAS